MTRKTATKTARPKIATLKTAERESTLREQIFQYLEMLHVPLSEEPLDQLLRACEQKPFSHLEFLARFLSEPANQRRERGIERRIKDAKFPSSATLENFDWDFNRKTIPQLPLMQLATGDFLARQENLVFAGKSGTGKTHLIEGVGRACCALGYRVRYVTSAELLEDLSAAAGEKTLPQRIRYYGRFDLLIIDELGFEKLELREYPEASSLLYKVIDHRSRRSTALVTNIVFKQWTDYFGDPPLTMALIDRVVDGAIIQEFDGRSYRAHRAQQKKAQQKARENGE